MLELGLEVCPAALTDPRGLHQRRERFASRDLLDEAPELALDLAELALEAPLPGAEGRVLLGPELAGSRDDVVNSQRLSGQDGHPSRSGRVRSVPERVLAIGVAAITHVFPPEPEHRGHQDSVARPRWPFGNGFQRQDQPSRPGLVLLAPQPTQMAGMTVLTA
jgi:hypothetical protein